MPKVLHRLLDELPESEWKAAQRYLEYLRDMGDPVSRALLQDAEPVTEEEERRAAEGRADLDRGDVVSHEQLRRDLGL